MKAIHPLPFQLLVLTALTACQSVPLSQAPAPEPLFILADEGRISTDGGATRGVGWADPDSDGDPDLAIANTSGQRNGVYLNQGEGRLASGSRFLKASDEGLSPFGSVASAGGNAEGVAWVDFDGDGDLDLHLVTRGAEPDLLFENGGKAGFVRVLDGPLVESRSHTMACWADVDLDSWPDVFLVGYREEGANALLANLGAGRFEVIVSSGIGGGTGAGRACAWGDPNGDGLPDLVVGNAEAPNELYWNRGGFVFEKDELAVHLAQHTAYTYGLSWADFDDDGDQDLFVANFDTNNVLYRNDGRGHLEPVLDGPVVTDAGGASKGHAWADFDLDGDLDLFVANGTYGPDMRNFLYLNQGDGEFLRAESGVLAEHADTSAGVAWADYDGDGDLDVFVGNWGSSDQVNRLYRNMAGEQFDRGWLQLFLRSATPNTRGLGAVVRVLATFRGQSRWTTRWHNPTTGYGSQNDEVVHFGLDDAPGVDSVVIHWPSGRVDRMGPLSGRGIWTIEEGGRAEPGRNPPSGSFN